MFDWDEEKNQWLKSVRGIAFEDVVFHISCGDLLDVLEHPNQERYSHQKVFIMNIEDYIYIVPYVEDEEVVFLKTIIPSRKMTKKYLGGKSK